MRSSMINAGLIATSALLLGACSNSTAPSALKRPISVSFTTAATAATFSRSPFDGASRSVSLVAGGNTLVITKAQLVLARVELEKVGAVCADTAASGEDSNNHDDCAELQLAPSVVDLPVDATVKPTISFAIPQGTYSQLEADIRAIRTGDAGAASVAFLKANPDLANVSVRVEGTYNGTPFVYKGTARAELERNFSPALTVDGSTVNLTVNVDLGSWFKSSTGAVIDPSTAGTGGSNASVVTDNIRRSLRAFRDNDHDGHEDR